MGALIPQGNGGVAVAEKTRSRNVPSPKAATRDLDGGSVMIAESVSEILISEIVANPEQPRVSFGHQELEDLTQSIREHGILQPLAVSPKDDGGYEIIAGERRFRAAKMAGLAAVPVVVRKADGKDKLVLALIENIQREDLNPIEEARAYGRLTAEFGLTQEEVAKKVGKARSTVANILRLLDLPEEIRHAVESGVVSAGSARALIGLSDDDERMRLFRKLVTGKMTTREAEAGARSAAGKSRRDPSALAVEEDLRAKFGTKVSVTKKQGKGKIAMSFYSDEEFGVLVEKLLK